VLKKKHVNVEGVNGKWEGRKEINKEHNAKKLNDTIKLVVRPCVISIFNITS
jgi:hypothetical protein